MLIDYVSSLLVVAGFAVTILSIGLFLLSVANVDISVRELYYNTGFLLSRPYIELNICFTTWLLMGYALANGGDIGLFLGTSEYVTIGTTSYEIWFYQATLLFVSATIFSNATLPRLMNGYARSFCVIFYSLVVFPVLYHWLWSIGGWASSYRSYYKDNLLMGCGAIDSAGSSIIHMAGGCATMVLLWLVNPRVPRRCIVPTAIPVQSDCKKSKTQGKDCDELEKERDLDKSVRSKSKEIKGNQLQQSYFRKGEAEEDEISPLLVESRSLASSFETKQLYSNLCAPVLLWVGFIALNAVTNLPAENSGQVGGKRCKTEDTSRFTVKNTKRPPSAQ